MRALGLILAVAIAAHANAQEISPGDVLASVERHHPTIAEAVAREDAARAEVMAARGGFDPQLSAYGAVRRGGYYDLTRVDIELRQPTPLWGAELWAGYRRGDGQQDRYPTYYDDETLDGGEIRAGVSVPLWRNGPLDARRAARERALFGADAAEQARRATELELRGEGLSAYWKWVAAGRQLAVTTRLRDLAQARLEQVRGRVRAGAIPEVEALEAERSVLSRQGSWVSARRYLEAAALQLSLYLRDRAGRPTVPHEGRLPSSLDLPPELPDVDTAVLRAVSCHPELRSARASIERSRVGRDLARARRAPQVDVSFQVSRDFGQGGTTLPGTVYEGGLRVAMPLGLRTARGELDAAEASLSAAEQSLRLKEDVLATKIRDVASAYRAAKERYDLAHALADTTERLATAELRRFEAGATTLLVVNLREQAAAEAAVAEVEAARDLWIAAAYWDALTTCPQ